MSERIMAHVELINNITPIEGADNIEVAHVWAGRLLFVRPKTTV